MRYYLDFHKTLFDTPAFTLYMTARGEGDFAPGELSKFLYPDVNNFLHEKGNAVTIITSGDRTLSEPIVQSAIYGIPRMSVMYVGETLKGEYLAPHTHLHQGACIVDDTLRQLESYASHCPDSMLIEMRRDGEQGDGRWPVVRMLSELPS